MPAQILRCIVSGSQFLVGSCKGTMGVLMIYPNCFGVKTI